jgi:hypothetical protein
VSGRTVTLTYTKVPGATAYILERAIQTASNSSTALSYAAITPTTPVGTPVETATTVSVVDTLPTDGDTYYYRLFVRTANGISTASTPVSAKSGEPVSVAQPSVYATSYTVTADATPGDGLDAEVRGIRVSINNVEAGAKYQVFARTVGGPNLKDVDEDNNNQYDKSSSEVDFGPWVAVNTTPITAATDLAPIYIMHTSLIQRQFYQYKAVATKTGLSSSESPVSSFNANGWIPDMMASVKSAIETSGLGGNSSGSGTAVTFTLNGLGTTTLQAGEKIEVYGFTMDYNSQTGIPTWSTQKVLVATIVAPAANSPIALTVKATNLPANTSSHTYSWFGFSFVVTAK